jgi:demethylmenaquinone methyltransferase / 2-methoxy-6-polyprenyl-1,4-benzoquinol methylase
MDMGQAARSGRLDADGVRTMFDRIAGIYDLMNTAMTAGQHKRWRQRAVDMARVGPGSRVLDVATGTGDMAIELARRVTPGGEVVGSDFSEAMLERARAKVDAGETDAVRPSFVWADAMTLPYASDSFDSATVGFGARNFEDLTLGLSEMVRVVRPAGRVVVLEITTPTRPILSLFYRVWFDRIVPLLGRLAAAGVAFASRLGGSGSGGAIADAYTYLPSSVKRFPEPAALAGELERAGLTDVTYVLMAGGIVAVHAGTVAPKQA